MSETNWSDKVHNGKMWLARKLITEEILKPVYDNRKFAWIEQASRDKDDAMMKRLQQ